MWMRDVPMCGNVVYVAVRILIGWPRLVDLSRRRLAMLSENATLLGGHITS
jgi:hypothetical protein